MNDDRAPLGLLIAALGAAVLAVSEFLPWYGVSITASGAASAQQELATVAQQYGNTAFQTGASQVGAEFSALAGRQVATVSAHDVLKDIGPILLILAAVSLLAALLRLAGVTGLFDAGGGQIALAGGMAALFVLLPDARAPGRTDGPRFALARLGCLACAPGRGSDRGWRVSCRFRSASETPGPHLYAIGRTNSLARAALTAAESVAMS
jgi:hypothetical protein